MRPPGLQPAQASAPSYAAAHACEDTVAARVPVVSALGAALPKSCHCSTDPSDRLQESHAVAVVRTAGPRDAGLVEAAERVHTGLHS